MRRFFSLTVGMLALALCLGVKGELNAQQVQQKVIPVQRPSIFIAQMEEELESLEAQHETRKAYVKAAEVGVKSAEFNQARVEKVVPAEAVSKEEIERAKLDVEAAKAKLEIRIAEMKEVEVRIKYAKKRLEMRTTPKEPAPPKDQPR